MKSFQKTQHQLMINHLDHLDFDYQFKKFIGKYAIFGSGDIGLFVFYNDKKYGVLFPDGMIYEIDCRWWSKDQLENNLIQNQKMINDFDKLSRF